MPHRSSGWSGRWFRFGFAPPLGFWFRSAWRFPRRDEYIKMLEDYRTELQEELAQISNEIEKLKNLDAQEAHAPQS